MSTVTIPRADLEAVTLDANGRFVFSRDLYRWMRDITARVGGVTAPTTGDMSFEIAQAKSMAGAAFAVASNNDGDQGDKGMQGETGPTGPQGAALYFVQDPIEPDFVVIPGPKGDTGATGPAGADGAGGGGGASGTHFLIDALEPDFQIPGPKGDTGAPGAGGSLSTASIPFTNGDTVQRVTVTDAAVSGTSKVLASIRRTDQADASADRGYMFMPNVVRIGSGSFDVQVVCLGLSGDDVTEMPPNETVTLTYSVA